MKLTSVLVAGAVAWSASALAVEPANGNVIERNGTVVPNDEQAFLERLHRGNQMEIREGELAQAQAGSEAVKAYARELIKDHIAADAKVLAYAEKRKLSLGDPRPIDAAEQAAVDAGNATMKKLQTLRSDAFDHAYLAAQLGMHDHTLAKVRIGAESFSGELAALLKGLLPTLTKHRQGAYQLLGKGEARSSGVGGSGGDVPVK